MPTHTTAPPVPTTVLGLTPEFTDPLWRVPVRLTPVEIELLRTEPLRRLHFVTHGGASTLTTLQSYSRLEHTLGVLSLAAHFHPDDRLLRLAALLHDIGHLPLSHTFEGVAGLDHHAIGSALLHADPIRPLLERHGIDPAAVASLLDGQSPSPLLGRPGLMNLDHLDSFVRSGRAAGHLDADPAALLTRLDLHDTVVSTDHDTAATLITLVRGEARLHTSWNNVGPVSVLRRLAARLLDHTPTLTPARLARLTDPHLWTALDTCPATCDETHRIRYEPHRLTVTATPTSTRPSGWTYSLRKIYNSAPLLDGRPISTAAPALAAELDALSRLPTHFHVHWA
ncbi:HD domain-containing protein [Kitasatospora sp. NPDC051853]|uniref:HD domain-containing protein n=1 Tax=Kitasatospora sp. NPDC051853 TaxID=3364058 RepID=UPI0037AF3A37